MCIADAIRKDWIKSENTVEFLSIIILISAVMDVFEFIKKIAKKN